ncbi:conserved membrane hypothetical protein [Candidatus Sulfobium mesophilum]|uniref:DUF4337 domain-containing protein n=1 Tax=Candidatus Sulfobium mesophilum TaxID=2016548 RepID=A0A2U3QKC2_9BACT|nr:conserved membrane hypothetical protein [Candidatus Sulfobium mesophilum]
MAEEKKEKWLNYLALTTVVFAVCATLSTFKGGNFSTLAVMSQSQASDQWSYYQAKSIKGYVYEIQKEKLELELKVMGQKAAKGIAEEYEKKLDAYAKKIKKYEDEKAKIEKEAKELERVRAEAQRHSRAFGVAVIFLQIAILLSSISALMKKKILWLLGSVVGVLGIVYFMNGFFLFIK